MTRFGALSLDIGGFPGVTLTELIFDGASFDVASFEVAGFGVVNLEAVTLEVDDTLGVYFMVGVTPLVDVDAIDFGT